MHIFALQFHILDDKRTHCRLSLLRLLDLFTELFLGYVDHLTDVLLLVADDSGSGYEAGCCRCSIGFPLNHYFSHFTEWRWPIVLIVAFIKAFPINIEASLFHGVDSRGTRIIVALTITVTISLLSNWTLGGCALRI